MSKTNCFETCCFVKCAMQEGENSMDSQMFNVCSMSFLVSVDDSQDSVVLSSTGCADSVCQLGPAGPVGSIGSACTMGSLGSMCPWVPWVLCGRFVRSSGFLITRRECFAHMFRQNARVIVVKN